MQIKPGDWKRVSPLLDAALDIDDQNRAAWLLEIERQDAPAARMLRDLLGRQCAVEAGDFLEEFPMIEGLDPEALSFSGSAAIQAGAAIGPYVLQSELGRGGMAEVWLAVRADGMLKRSVALKLPHAHLLSGQLRQRFERERDILAALSHSHIAALYDAGVSEAGHPYLAMEWIDGTPITRYCRDGELSIDARLDLFEQVLDAVDYAHARFIAHRDLKPSNIMVTREGSVKLLDFGIAKLLNSDSDGSAADMTLVGGRAVTPNYAAPEQIAGEPITTAVDLYALGVVLFELLTGARPFESGGLIGARSGDAPLASQRTSDSQARAAGCRDAAQLCKRLRGDLDAIVAKAVEYDPLRRYQSAADFLRDLRHHRSNEPISARRIGRWELTRKFVSRNQPVATLTAALAVALVAGMVAFAWQAQKARHSAQTAVEEAARAQGVARREKATKEFLISVFSANDPRIAAERPRGTVTAGELLDASAGHIQETFAGDPDTEIELLGIVTDIYQSIEDFERYGRLHPIYLALMKTRYGVRDPRVIEGMLDEAYNAMAHGDGAHASLLLGTTDELIRACGLDHSKIRAKWWLTRAEVLRPQPGTDPDRKSALERAIALYGETAPTDDAFAAALSALGGLYFRADDDRTAIRLVHRAIEVLQARFGGNYAGLAPAFANVAAAEEDDAEFEAALGDYSRSIAISRRTYGVASNPYRVATANYARLLHERGERARALQLFASIDAGNTEMKIAGDDVFAVQAAVLVRRNYGYCLLAEGRPRAAIPLLRSAIELTTAHPMYGGDKLPFRIRTALGQAYAQAGRSADAQRELTSVVAELARDRSADDPVLLTARESLGRFYQRRGAESAARRQFEQILANAHERIIAPVARAYGDLALLAMNHGQIPLALELSERAVVYADKAVTEPDVRLQPELWNVKAQVLLHAGDLHAALEWATRALEANRRYDDESSAQIADSVVTQRMALALPEARTGISHSVALTP